MSMVAWILAARPKTLLAGVAPVILGSTLGAQMSTTINWVAALACLVGAMLIQVATNYANDAIDAGTGADDERRVGPQRAVASGLISPRAMFIATSVLLAAAFAIGCYLALLGGPVIFILGVISLLCAYAYTGGPFPLAYRGLGDLFVWLFFGLFAVLGSAWVQCAPYQPLSQIVEIDTTWWGPLPAAWWLLAAAVGWQATAIIAINNLRDHVTDAEVGKNTLAVRLGPTLTRYYYATLHVAAGIAYAWAAWYMNITSLGIVAGCAWCFGILLSVLAYKRSAAQLNPLLGLSAALELFCAVLAAILIAVH